MTLTTRVRMLEYSDSIPCQFMGCDDQAHVCQKVKWKVGSVKGISFFYCCVPHIQQID